MGFAPYNIDSWGWSSLEEPCHTVQLCMVAVLALDFDIVVVFDQTDLLFEAEDIDLPVVPDIELLVPDYID